MTVAEFEASTISTAEFRTLAERYGTPLIVIDLRRIRSNLERISRALRSQVGHAAQPHFAVKSCYVPAVLDAVRTAGWGAEVMSNFELRLATAAGFKGDNIILTGLGWGLDTCRDAMAAGVGRFIVDTDEDLADLALAIRGQGDSKKSPEIFIRVNLAEQVTGTFLQANGKLGRSPSTLAALARHLSAELNVSISGVHVHQFNRLTDLRKYAQALELVTQLRRHLESEGIRCSKVDIGGGLESLSRLDASGVPFEEFAAAMGKYLGPDSGVAFVATEFGRAVVGDAGFAIGKVTAVKRASGHCTTIVDIPTNTLIPLPGAVYPPVPLEDASGQARRLESCSFTDGTGSPVEFAHDVRFPSPRKGDLICLTEAGAYTTVFTELWAAPLPTIAVITNDHSITYREGAAMTRDTMFIWYGDASWTDDPRPKVLDRGN